MHKLSKVQIELLNLMNNGWELGTSLDLNSRCWVQKGGLGHGGESKTFNTNTVSNLIYHGYITSGVDKFPTRHHKLTEKGLEYIKAEQDKGVNK